MPGPPTSQNDLPASPGRRRKESTSRGFYLPKIAEKLPKTPLEMSIYIKEGNAFFESL